MGILLKRWKPAVSGLLLLLGLEQLGWGGYIQAKAWLAQQLMLRAWEQAEQGEPRPRPWSWADTWPVARLQVERLGVDQILLAGASGRTLAFGPGHLSGTAMPGTAGHSVLSGHRDTHFAFLRDLEPGERLRVLLPDGRERSYEVGQIGVYHRDQLWILDQPEVDRLTLVTCYPFDAVNPGGPLRYVVQAQPRTELDFSLQPGRSGRRVSRSVSSGAADHTVTEAGSSTELLRPAEGRWTAESRR